MTPRIEYAARLEARKAEAARLRRIDRAIVRARLALMAILLAMVPLLFGELAVFAWFGLLPLFTFVGLAVPHDRVLTALQDANRAGEFYAAGLRRTDGNWQGTGVWGDEFRVRDHPYADDLDMFGRASLFEFLCTARTGIGQWTLARCLLAPAAPSTILDRQVTVAELAELLDFREELAVIAADAPSPARTDAIRLWATDPPLEFPRWARPGAVLLGAANLTGAALWADGFGPAAFFAGAAITSVFLATLGNRPSRSLKSAEEPARDLGKLSLLLPGIEQRSFDAPMLQEAHSKLSGGGHPASDIIRRLQKWLYLRDSLANILFAPIAAMLLIPLHTAIGIEAWKRRYGAEAERWIEAIGEVEALCSLAALRYEQQHDVFPEIVENGVCLEAKGLAHPLIHESHVVRNDVSLGGPSRLLIVSGSNMSGKSTLLRSIGTNVVLALAGAPVTAQSMRVSPLAVGASIRTVDSLEAGISRFYAEILRLHQIVELTRAPRPVLFLLDEILHGTNSHDRRIGAEAVLRSLVAAGAIGLATTHDLALAMIAESPESTAVNVHFEDQLVDGKMSFDYHLRPGTVQHSNALALMRSIGLDV